MLSRIRRAESIKKPTFVVRNAFLPLDSSAQQVAVTRTFKPVEFASAVESSCAPRDNIILILLVPATLYS
jgi:hypothetical protein